jgi:GNAT superfamily N-acetyltransferase
LVVAARSIGDGLRRFGDAKRRYGLRRALLALLSIIAKRIHSNELHVILFKIVDEGLHVDRTDALVVRPVETLADLRRAVSDTHHYFLRSTILANYIKSGCRAQLACGIDGEPLGYLWWATDDEHPDLVLHEIELAEGDAYVFSLVVTPAGREKGVAPVLLRQTEAALCDSGYRRMVGWVDARNRPARWLFATNGFEETATVRVINLLSLATFSPRRILVRNFGWKSRYVFGYRLVWRAAPRAEASLRRGSG